MYAIVVTGLLLFPWALAIVIAAGSFRPARARIIGTPRVSTMAPVRLDAKEATINETA